MDSPLFFAAVTMSAAIVGALIQAFGRDVWDMLPQSGPKYPMLGGVWDATWWVQDEDGNESVYIKDAVEIRQRGRGVWGTGRDARARGDYVLKGRFNSHGIVTLSYEYKMASMAGSLTLKADPVSRTCEGRWHGYTEEDAVVSGRVEWAKRPG